MLRSKNICRLVLPLKIELLLLYLALLQYVKRSGYGGDILLVLNVLSCILHCCVMIKLKCDTYSIKLTLYQSMTQISFNILRSKTIILHILLFL